MPRSVTRRWMCGPWASSCTSWSTAKRRSLQRLPSSLAIGSCRASVGISRIQQCVTCLLCPWLTKKIARVIAAKHVNFEELRGQAEQPSVHRINRHVCGGIDEMRCCPAGGQSRPFRRRERLCQARYHLQARAAAVSARPAAASLDHNALQMPCSAGPEAAPGLLPAHEFNELTAE
jgi:hypothetical protein